MKRRQENGAVPAGEEGNAGAGRRRAVRASREIAYIALAVALITVCAWISLPIGEVPFTLQTFSVAAVGGLLGWKRGTAAVAVYLLMGLIGIPVFAGFKAGAAAFLGATGGYTIGFLFSAFLAGIAKSFPIRSRIGRTAAFFAMMCAGLALCYLFGTAWFLVVYNRGSADPVGIGVALMLCVVPFLVPDLIKLVLAAVLSVQLSRFLKL